MRAAFTVKGIDEYLEKLRQAGEDLDAAVDVGLKNAAEILIAEMRARVPVDSGNLRDHLVVNGPFRIGDAHFVYVELDMIDREAMLYGVFQEFGTPHMEPHSYIRAGKAAGKSRARKALVDALNTVTEFK